MKIELGREAATLIMLAALAGAIAAERKRFQGERKRFQGWLGAFLLAFGVWDLAFYLWLRVLIGWPPSLLTWDLLFLLPVPWAAPVLAPSIVAVTMTVFGARMLARPFNRESALGYLPLAIGAAVLLASFTWDWRRWLAGAMPDRFPWAIFGIGEALIIAGFLAFFRRASVPRNYIEIEASKLE